MQPRASSHDNRCSQQSFLLLIFFGPILVSAFPKRDWLLAGRVPPSPSISGIIEFGENRKLNLGVQSLAGKILMSKNLAFALPGSIPGTGRMRSLPTVTASTMIARLRGCAQGQMSHAPVEKPGTAPLKAKIGLEWATYWNGLMIRTPSISRAACMSSEKSVLHPACLAERTINASQKFMP